MLCTALEDISSTCGNTPIQHSPSQYSSQGPRVLPAPVCPLRNLQQLCPLYLSKGRTEEVTWDKAFTGSCLRSPPCSSQHATSCGGQTSATAQYAAVKRWKETVPQRPDLLSDRHFFQELVKATNKMKFHMDSCAKMRRGERGGKKPFFIKKGNHISRTWNLFS